jgi:hypothetical protein
MENPRKKKRDDLQKGTKGDKKVVSLVIIFFPQERTRVEKGTGKGPGKG